ncbi:hypothetical protein PAT3040_04183 [Paenibacillus agaridevorans]|uniref:Copper amine oxidase-like N-terminal domain-containing protein n=1 Tax=Paenibacillus agaridevorans TaxID=171404 RepID=A0A2R5F0D1_9BACL|nr:hypothetical protein [Paenibacillus agaridevorans]GBG09533.1 hypothetical protein PAT3040_04183 [Paenibacillus agaridevorans]
MDIIKKFILGLICGIGIITFTAAAVSEEVRAKLTPVYVNFHMGGDEHSLSSDDTKILNYKGHLFVPLRSFANEIGGSVYYTAPVGSDRAQVDIYYEDDRDVTLKDKEGYVRLGNLGVKFALNDDIPVIEGSIKIDKTIPKDKDVVISILDSKGKTLGVSSAIEPYQPSHVPLSQLKQGDTINFRTNFPYMETPESYTLKVELVKKTDWFYVQGGVVAVWGAGGFYGFPLNPAIYGTNTNHKLGDPTPISVTLINLSDDDNVVTTKPVSFEVEISDSTGKLIRTLTTKPFMGEVQWKKGMMRTTIVWDQKDSSGKKIAKGEYNVKILSNETEGYMKSNPDNIVKFGLENSMQAGIPLYIT